MQKWGMCTDTSNACYSSANPRRRFASFGCIGSLPKTHSGISATQIQEDEESGKKKKLSQGIKIPGNSFVFSKKVLYFIQIYCISRILAGQLHCKRNL